MAIVCTALQYIQKQQVSDLAFTILKASSKIPNHFGWYLNAFD